MEILKYHMPPFSRMQWASKTIKDKYEPMLNKAKNVFSVLEKQSVIHGLRGVTTDNISPPEMDFKLQEYAKQGLTFLPIQRVGDYSGRASYHPPVVEGKPWRYYGVVAKDIKLAMEFAEASGGDVDHVTIGRLLGYPDCCVNFFEEKFNKARIADTTWQQAQNTKNIIQVNDRTIKVKNIEWESNNMLRNILVGPTFHTTCSFDCPHSTQINKDWIQLAKDLKVEGLAEMEMFMRMPMEWDALKGIAYIRTPIFKLSINTVMCTETHKVQLEGSYYPEDSPRAITFPWNQAFSTVKKHGNKLTLGEVL